MTTPANPQIPTEQGRLERTFLDAVDEPDGPTREAALRASCGDDLTLLAEVRRLLAADAANADGLLSPAAHRDRDAAPDEDVPVTIGGYDVVRYVDGGAVGTVFEARHAATGRRAAVKLIRVGLATARQRARFQVEAELLARLSDPGIARLYDAGQAAVTYADGQRARRVFIAMEFVDGPDVLAHCGAGQLSVADRVGLMVAAARAVQHAHERGVVHRDLKPSHVLIARGDGRPRVVDFGIATVADPAARMTVTGAVMGTPAYMSPEQRAGHRDRVGPPSDVFSLAAILYELLAGRPVIDGPGAMMFGRGPVSPPRRLRAIAAGVPRDLDAVVHEALSVDPDDRYPTARAFADDLQRWLDSRPVRARPPSVWERAGLQARRRPRLVTAGAVAAVAVATLGTATAWQAVRAVRAERVALARLATADRERATADREKAAADREQARADHQSRVSSAVARFLSEQIIGRADSGRQLRDAGGANPDLTLRQAIDRAAAQLDDASFDADPDTEVAIRRAVADAYEWLGEQDRAVPQYESAGAVLRRTRGPDAAETLDLESALSNALNGAHRSDEAIAVLRHVYAADVATRGEASPQALIALRRLTTAIVFASGTSEEAVTLLRRSVALNRQAFGPDDSRFVRQMWGLAYTLSNRGDGPGSRAVLVEMIPFAEACLALCRQSPGPDDPATINVEITLAMADDQLGRFDRGVPLLRDVLARRTRVLGPDHPLTFQATGWLVVALHGTGPGGDDELRRLVEPELARNLRLRGPDHPDTLTAMSWVVSVLIEQKHPDQAEPIARDLVARAQRRHFQSAFLPQTYIDLLNRSLADQHKPPYEPDAATRPAATRPAATSPSAVP